MQEIISRNTVPWTDVEITISFRPADPRLAKILKDPAGKGSWIDFYYIARNPGSATFVNYLATGRSTLTEARAEANSLWTDTVQRRNAAKAEGRKMSWSAK